MRILRDRSSSGYKLYLPSATAPDQLELDAGETEPRLEVTVSCAQELASLGPGRRDLRLDLPAAGVRGGLRGRVAVQLRATGTRVSRASLRIPGSDLLESPEVTTAPACHKDPQCLSSVFREKSEDC